MIKVPLAALLALVRQLCGCWRYQILEGGQQGWPPPAKALPPAGLSVTSQHKADASPTVSPTVGQGLQLGKCECWQGYSQR